VSLVRLLSGLAKRFVSFMREMDLGLAVMHSQRALLGRSGERRGGGLREGGAIGGGRYRAFGLDGQRLWVLCCVQRRATRRAAEVDRRQT
jgi:hypothetical protein